MWRAVRVLWVWMLGGGVSVWVLLRVLRVLWVRVLRPWRSRVLLMGDGPWWVLGRLLGVRGVWVLCLWLLRMPRVRLWPGGVLRVLCVRCVLWVLRVLWVLWVLLVLRMGAVGVLRLRGVSRVWVLWLWLGVGQGLLWVMGSMGVVLLILIVVGDQLHPALSMLLELVHEFVALSLEGHHLLLGFLLVGG